MTTRRRIEDKVGDWSTAYWAIREELTTSHLRAKAYSALEQYDDAINYPEVRAVAANDRTAALVAGLLVGAGGARPIPTDALEDR